MAAATRRCLRHGNWQRLPAGVLETLQREVLCPRGETDNLHRRLTVSPDWLSDILCRREQRYVGQQLPLAYDRKQLILDRSAFSEDLGGQYVDLYDFADGRVEGISA